jgi:poly(A) polymerase
MNAPRVIPRAEHQISRKQISSACIKVLYTLKEAGFQAFLVGGAVRDLLLGVQPKDFDVATDATPEQTERLFRRCRLIGRRFVIVHVRFGDEVIEVTTFRGLGNGTSDAGSDAREVEAGGRILRDNVFGSVEEDAVRRDFSVNALYYNINDFSVVDFVGGLDDLEHRRLRLIGDPVLRYREDPVRMLRAARLKAKLGFSLDAGTRAPIREMAGELRSIPPARLFEEVLKMFLTGHAQASLTELRDLGLFEVLFPSLARRLDSKPEALALLQAALANTDERIAADKPVAAGFLIAAMGWPLLDQGKLGSNDPDQQHDACESAIAQLANCVALPRRFSLQAREIWEMQVRLQRASASRARRLLGMPRLRAGYDFLGLRALVEPELLPLFQRWTDAQEPDAPLERLFARTSNAANASAEALEDAVAAPSSSEAPPRKRKRRRKRKPIGSQPEAPDA